MEDLPPLFAPGQRLGRYELLQRLAVGGMAEVYLAYSVGPGDFRKVVAIKRLLPQHALDPQLLRMFLDEARLMARLSHPNIPHVTDVDDGASGDVPYFVMEYIHGTDLRGVLNAAGGPLPFEQALAITSAVAAGLHHAHEHRGGGGQRLEIVHRDVSPSNILISFDGGVKITDFGVAKWTEQKSFTHQGQLKGKFAHMSPEQCRGESLDRRSDVFALGTLLYEMTTGHPPFVAESEYELLTQIVSRDAAPPRRPGEIFPPQLESIVMRSLRRDRTDRYASTQDLQLDLEAFAREHRLIVSPVALAGYLESLFGAEVTEWRAALASGRTLADHMGKTPARLNPDRAQSAHERPGTADRTATDAHGGSVSPAASPTAAGRARGKFTRAVAIAAGTLVGLALVFVATEITSRWQRASQARLGAPPLGGISGIVNPTARAIMGPNHQTVSSSVADSAPARTPARHPSSAPDMAAGEQAAPGSARSAVSSRPSVRRGRESGLRLARREAVAAGPKAGAVQESRRTTPATTAALSAEPPAGLPASAPVPTSATPAARAGVDPPTPVKVWDPDSPVPP